MEKKGRLKNKIKNFGIGNNEDSEKKKKKLRKLCYSEWDLNTGYYLQMQNRFWE